MGISPNVIQLIRSLHSDQEATVTAAFGDTEWFKNGKVTCQGCILLTSLFHMYRYAEVVMKKTDLE